MSNHRDMGSLTLPCGPPDEKEAESSSKHVQGGKSLGFSLPLDKRKKKKKNQLVHNF